jgi:uncharacterized protein YabE (DUF348 family)
MIHSLHNFLQERIYFLALLFALMGLVLIFFATTTRVGILLDGQWVYVDTHARTVGRVLQDAGIELLEGDKVVPDPSSRLDSRQIIEVQRAVSLYLDIDGKLELWTTTESTAANILASAGVTLLPGDRIWIDGIPESQPGSALTEIPQVIRFREAKAIVVEMDGREEVIHSSAPTLGEALEEAGIEVYEGDVLEPSAATSLEDLNRVVVIRAKPIQILADGIQIQRKVVAMKVGEALLEAGVPLMGLDYTIPDAEDEIPDDGQIRIVRVVEEILVEQTPLPFETIYEADAELEIDNQVVTDPGAYGIKATRVRVRYEDGEEVSRNTEGEWVAREPQPRKIGYGTKIVIRTLNTSDGTIQYWRAIRMWATSYSPSRAGVSEDYPWFGITACGKKLKKGLVAIDNRYIPFHTMMYVPGYGYAEACDTGGGVSGRWIDLGYSDENYKEWHEYVTVYFLTPVPATVAWIFP